MIFSAREDFPSPLSSCLERHLDEAQAAVAALTGPRIIESFRKNDDGGRGQSIVFAMRRILQSELRLRGWEINWPIFELDTGYGGATFKLDAFKTDRDGGHDCRVGTAFGWGVRSSGPGTLIRAELMRSTRMQTEVRPLDLMIVIAPTAEFKQRGNLDTNALTFSDYVHLARPYSGLVRTPTIILPIPDTGGYVVDELPGDKTRKSRIRDV